MPFEEINTRHAELTAQIAAAAPEYGADVHAQAAWAIVHYPRMADARSWLYALGDREGPIGMRSAKALRALSLFELAQASKKAA